NAEIEDQVRSDAPVILEVKIELGVVRFVQPARAGGGEGGRVTRIEHKRARHVSDPAELVNDRVLQAHQIVRVDAVASRRRQTEATETGAAAETDHWFDRGAGDVRTIVTMPVETEIDSAFERVRAMNQGRVVDVLKRAHATRVVREVGVFS